MKEMPTKKQRGDAWPVLRNYGQASSKYPLLVVALLTGSILYEVGGVIAPLFIKEFIDTIASGSVEAVALGTLFTILASYAALQALRWVIGRGQILALLFLDTRVVVDLYEKAYAYLMGHSHHFFTSNFAGSLQRRVSRYAQSFSSVLNVIIFNFVTTVVYSAGAIWVLSTREPILGIVIILWAIAFIYLQVVLARWRHPLRLARAATESRLTGALSDSISNQSTVAQFAATGHERGILNSVLELWRKATMRTNIADFWIWGTQGFLAIVVEVVILFVAAYLWKQGALTVGDFALIQIYLVGLIDRIWNLGNSIRQLYSTFADAHEMIEIFETPYEVTDAPDAHTLIVDSGNITFDKVSFSFKEGREVLSDFSLTISAGEKVALVGPSGAGKSTVTKLLLRLYDTTTGRIQVDGQDIAAVTQLSLREAISFVPQEPILFHRSLYENIKYGRPGATLEEVIEAAKKAHCHEFISQFPKGYETFVGERGVKLSGGERQRVAIARAILKNSPILILDEATSALDSESEALIQDALRILMEGKTVIVIAHRLSTIMRMDRILVMEKGRIASSGTHDELLNDNGGLYQKLWNIQAGGFITE